MVNSSSQLPALVHLLCLGSFIFIFAIAPTDADAEKTDGSTLASAPQTVNAWLWNYNYKTSRFDRTYYVVNPMMMTIETPSPASIDVEPSRADRWRVNIEAYNRLQERLNEVAAPERDPDLVTAVREIEKSKTWGQSPGNQLLLSPDGHRLVLRPVMSVPIVVDLTTLRTQQIVKHPDPLDIPVAWSPDSRRLAFAPSEAKEIVIYDADEGVVETRLQGFWVQAIAWSPDMQTLALMTLVNRRLYKTPKGLVAAWAGHPDFRNDLILETRAIATQKRQFVQLKSNLDEQSTYQYWMEWH